MKVKAYRPYDTFGLVDVVRTFNSVEECLKYYEEWANGVSRDWEVEDTPTGCTLISTQMSVYCGVLEETGNIDDAIEQSTQRLDIEVYHIDNSPYQLQEEVSAHFECSGGVL